MTEDQAAELIEWADGICAALWCLVFLFGLHMLAVVFGLCLKVFDDK